MAKKSVGAEVTLTLGQYLTSIRVDRGITLREVEKRTNKVVSNAYLSQIENDQIKKPNPNILTRSPSSTKIPYEDLMERAGFVGADAGARQRPAAPPGRHLCGPQSHE